MQGLIVIFTNISFPEENGDGNESAMNETTGSKMEEEEGKDEEHPLDSGEFVMLDEAGNIFWFLNLIITSLLLRI